MYCRAEQITLKTIVPDQNDVRMSRAVVGDQENARTATWNHNTVDLQDDSLLVGYAIGVGTNSPGAELHLKETGCAGTRNSPRLVMEDGNPANKPFMIEYDTEFEGTASEVSQIEWYFPADPSLPSIGLFLSAHEDLVCRFYHKLIVNPVSTAGRQAFR